jgi:hypothetical protein
MVGEIQSGQPTFGGNLGATMQPQYMVRTMKCYAVQETEMEMVDTFIGQATTFYSTSSALVSFAASIWINAAFATTLTDTAKLSAFYFAPLCVIGSIVFVKLGYDASRKRKTLWATIKAQSEAIATTTVFGAVGAATGASTAAAAAE